MFTRPAPGDDSNSTDSGQYLTFEIEKRKTDSHALQLLGYDAVLGRPLGFWSSYLMSIAHMSAAFEFCYNSRMYAYRGPILFIAGYPIVALLHLILLGPFGELASAYPVAGAMATWSWRAARQGVRHERQWGWLASGMGLAAHLGKMVATIFHIVSGAVSLYVSVNGYKHDPDTNQATRPELWWSPTFHLVIVGITTTLIVTRAARHHLFWVAAGLYDLLLFVFLIGCLIAVTVTKKHALPNVLDFPIRDGWTRNLSWILFMGLPLKVTPVDAPAHMAEETVNPAVNVPRSMIASSLTHHAVVYVLNVLFIVYVAPIIKGFTTTPLAAMSMIFGWAPHMIVVVVVLFFTTVIFQLVASCIVTSRFLFALARDDAIPFSDVLVKTDRHHEPWVANLLVIVVMYVCIAGWLVNQANYYYLLQTFNYTQISVAYIIPLFLYLASKLTLQHSERTQFTVRGWSKPMSAIAILWMVLCILQGSLPISFWARVVMPELTIDSFNYFPIALAAMLLITAVSWYCYGRFHYIGPIRALTRWTAGIELGPGHAAGHSRVVKEYLDSQTGRGSGFDSSGRVSGGLLSSKRLRRVWHRSSIPSGSSGDSTGTGYTTSSTSGLNKPTNVDVQPESQVLPETRASNALPGSRILPTTTVAEIASRASMTMSMRAALDELDIMPDARSRQLTATMEPAVMESQLEASDAASETTFGTDTVLSSQTASRLVFPAASVETETETEVLEPAMEESQIAPGESAHGHEAVRRYIKRVPVPRI